MAIKRRAPRKKRVGGYSVDTRIYPVLVLLVAVFVVAVVYASVQQTIFKDTLPPIFFDSDIGETEGLIDTGSWGLLALWEPGEYKTWALGPTETLATDGNYLYYASGTTFMAYDVNDLSNPVFRTSIGGMTFGFNGGPESSQLMSTNGNAVACSLAGVDGGMDGVSLIDTSNWNAQIIDVGRTQGTSFDGNRLLVTTGSAVYAIDATDPSNPGTPQIFYSGGRSGVLAGDDFIFTSSGNVVYVHDKVSGAVVDSYTPDGYWWCCDQSGGDVWSSGNVFDMDVDGSTLFVTRGYFEVESLSISPTGQLTRLDSFMSPLTTYYRDHSGEDVWVGVAYKKIALTADKNRLLVTEHDGKGQGIEVLDVSDPSNINHVQTGEYIGTAYPRDIAPLDVGSFAIALGYYGVGLYDLPSPPADPIAQNHILAYGGITDAAFKDGYAFGIEDRQMRTIDFNLDTPEIISSFDIQGRATGIDLQGDYLFTSSASSGVHILDISDPYNPTEAWAWNPDYTYGINADGNYLYIMEANNGLHIFDISNIPNVFEVGYIAAPSGDIRFGGMILCRAI